MHARGADDAMNTHSDSIVAETRAIRQELASRFGSDIQALCDFLVEKEGEHKDRLVNYAPKAPQVVAVSHGE
jgi:hypothetical protein